MNSNLISGGKYILNNEEIVVFYIFNKRFLKENI